MAELEAEEITEKELDQAINFAHEQAKQILNFFQQIANSLGVFKISSHIPEKPSDLSENSDFLILDAKNQDLHKQIDEH